MRLKCRSGVSEPHLHCARCFRQHSQQAAVATSTRSQSHSSACSIHNRNSTISQIRSKQKRVLFLSFAMKRSFPWDEPVEILSYDSSSSNSSNPLLPLPTNDIPLPIPTVDITSQDILIRRAEMYRDYMKQIPIPSHRGSVIPFTSWMGLGRSIKQLYGQPLHYLTNVLLKQWDQLRIGSENEYKPLDNMIHPCKAEATVWLIEEVHRQTSSHSHIAKLWMADPMYKSFFDSIFPTLEPEL